ncbi:hypothetical protein K470DRAFT_259178 [Piedraia hortae CBS 480.64]|uniref:Uncharacterized protein n=1 Tax=Piedraia hortae CBS 480.64 TaxID=1314780 RepID=A0A6A7BV95_9PEZI|nr:hypothetical protein K470DRAFT_259178 [Piedraia hortae CBS 480.64]
MPVEMADQGSYDVLLHPSKLRVQQADLLYKGIIPAAQIARPAMYRYSVANIKRMFDEDEDEDDGLEKLLCRHRKEAGKRQDNRAGDAQEIGSRPRGSACTIVDTTALTSSSENAALRFPWACQLLKALDIFHGYFFVTCQAGGRRKCCLMS